MTGNDHEERRLAAAVDSLCRSFDDAPTGVFVCTLDGTCIGVNRRLLTWLRPTQTPDDLRGAPLQVHDVEGLAEALYRVADGDATELDASVLPLGNARGQWRLFVLPFRADDRVVAALIVVDDLLEASLAVQAFAASERRFRLLVDSASDGIAAVRDGTVLYVNRAGANVLGAEAPASLVGRPVAELVSDEDRPEFLEWLDGMRRSASLDPTEVRLVRCDGAVVSLEMSASREPTGAENDAGFLFFRDVTEKRRLQAELERAARMESLGRLAGGIAHEFNNLLTGIRASLQMARRSSGDLVASSEALDRAEAASLRAADVVRQLLTFSRGPGAEATRIDPNPIVREAVGLVAAMGGKDVEIELVLDPDAGTVFLSPGHLHQIVLNLLINARDSIPQRGRVRVHTTRRQFSEGRGEPAGPWVVLTVADTGAGMDASTRSRIFEPFFTTKAALEGTGLGLATVYGIVRQAGGHIDVKSEVGHGTTFRVFLPRVDGELARQERAQVLDASETYGRRETVLVCDDEPRLATLTAGLLDPLGYRALTAFDAERAFSLLLDGGEDVRLLVLDVHLRPTPAKDVLARMVAHGVTTPVILSSGFSREDIGDALLSNPLVVGYLAKPYPVEELARMIREALDHPRHVSSSVHRGLH